MVHLAEVAEDAWAAPVTAVFAFVGVLWLSLKIFSFWRLVASLFVLPGTSLSKFGKKGKWALVTGASDGIGKEYALQIAQKGYNILLVSRTQSKLDSLSTEIQRLCNVQTKCFAMDFAANNDSDYTKLRSMVDELDVSILINNVGLSHSIPVPFAETDEKEMKDIITINCTGTLRVTQLVLPGMVKRKAGLILTMASFGGLLPTPLLATYSGSKAFLQQWSSALGSEVAPHGIKVQLVQSYLVTSAMSKIRRSSAMIPTPKQFVRAALGKIGRSGGAQGISATSTPYWAHGVMHWALDTLTPGRMNSYVIDVNRGMHEDIRKRALRKAERDAKKSRDAKDETAR
ncbi:Very-long-chain 3-oxoacyl-CoA [Hortaea werneckii]|nr:Very-long-chain 3-oxoacyl-CoA [Hortaea werneckii]KAI7101341.1 Very-long-chain 3-oxoacyl-CoA [Hortaea werneckii]KAI7242957.1 Very-long-chain 3-oxoacyl-CoA [Hortaea werneckii]KAI7324971.1 Very-long-chain 3-oxoacyl-CoA [Hortaea werneckii]KAI7390640.1 Very-long-chain 3-oxoacyl-CoA [Hortaea werneckii]